MPAPKFSFESFRSHLCDYAMAVIVAMSTHLKSKAGLACRNELIAARDALVSKMAEHQQAEEALSESYAAVVECRASIRIGNAMAINLGRRDDVAALSAETSRGKNEMVVPTAWKLLLPLRAMGTTLASSLADFLARECERIGPLEVEVERLRPLIEQLDEEQTPLAETLAYAIEQGRASLLAHRLPAPLMKWRTVSAAAKEKEETQQGNGTTNASKPKVGGNGSSPPTQNTEAETTTTETEAAA